MPKFGEGQFRNNSGAVTTVAETIVSTQTVVQTGLVTSSGESCSFSWKKIAT